MIDKHELRSSIAIAIWQGLLLTILSQQTCGAIWGDVIKNEVQFSVEYKLLQAEFMCWKYILFDSYQY